MHSIATLLFTITHTRQHYERRLAISLVAEFRPKGFPSALTDVDIVRVVDSSRVYPSYECLKDKEMGERIPC